MVLNLLFLDNGNFIVLAEFLKKNISYLPI